MEEDLYDEFGNYIGPDIKAVDDDSDQEGGGAHGSQSEESSEEQVGVR
jgi:U5 small nuclear ribonucleoprotein component